jgi:MOSC domain-containing protein YiiM
VTRSYLRHVGGRRIDVGAAATPLQVDSQLTCGVPLRDRRGMHVDLSTLEAGIGEIRRSPAEVGTVELIVRRPAENEREVLSEAQLDTGEGMIGDGWLARDGDVWRQITVMNARSVALLAGSRDRWPLAGDQLYVDFDLSAENLPPGARVEVGAAILEVSDKPHRGCKKFSARYGLDALRFVNSRAGYALNLRGINARVVRSGVVRAGDTVRKLTSGRPST